MILTVDVGTTSLKGGLFSLEGALAARAEVPVHLADRNDPLHHEADANNWLSALGMVAAQLEVSRVRDLAAVVVSGNGPTLVPVGPRGRPLDFAMTWMDRRGVEEARLVGEASGRYVDPTFYLPKAYWIFRNRPKLYDRARWFMTCPEFLVFHLTGEAVTVLPGEGFKPYMWTEEVIDRLEMDPRKFPPYVRTGQLVGPVRRESEETLGIPAGVPVFGGGPDFIMTLLGTATVVPGRACDRAGTSEGINLCSPKPLGDSRLLCLPHPIEGLHNVSGIISTSGKALEWFKNLSGRREVDYETLFEDICQAPAGARGLLFLPYLAGERAPLWDPYARGCFVGLTMNHGRREMTRAVVESVGFAIRDVIEVMGENGLELEELRATGGQARSPLWNQVKADITGKRILVPESLDSELLGDACVGLYALGRFGSLVEAAERIVRIRRTYAPNSRLRSLYADLFALYRQAYRGLKEVFAGLAHIPVEEEG